MSLHLVFWSECDQEQRHSHLLFSVPMPSAPLSRPPFTEWQLELPLALTALGFLAAGALCLFRKHQGEEHHALPEEETGQAETAQRPQASSTKAEPSHGE